MERLSGLAKCKPLDLFKLQNSNAAVNRMCRKASSLWDAENDPFQVFEVEHESCLDLSVEVIRGENITKGFYKDLLDIPDPYVILRVPGSSNSSKRTSHIDNTASPEWNETFHFFLDPKDPKNPEQKRNHILQVTLMDANHFQDESLGMEELELAPIMHNIPTPYVFTFPGGSRIHTMILMRKNPEPDLRFSLSLCEEEKRFLRERRQKVLTKMKALLGDKGPKDKDEVPIIAILGSGGGFRAMIALMGATKALYETGILDCATYLCGLSGSSWFISTLYAHNNLGSITFDEIYEGLKDSVTVNWKWNVFNLHKYIIAMIEKKRIGQPVSFTDIFGYLLGDVLLKENKNKKLSDQRQALKTVRLPLPIYTCLHAKATVSCRSFSEWIEFTPFEIGIAKYGTFMKTEDFGSKFLVGKLIKRYPEFPLHYLQGVWGSAFTILMKRLLFDRGAGKKDLIEMMRDVNEERAINEKLESENMGEDDEGKRSDTDDEADVEGADDKSEEEEEESEEAKKLEEEQQLKEILGTVEAASLFPPKPPSLKKNKQNFSFDEVMKKLDKKTHSGHSLDHGASPNRLGNDLVTRTYSKERSYSVPNIIPIGNTRKPLERKAAIKEGTAVRPNQRNYWSSRRKTRRTQKAKKSSFLQNLLSKSGILDSRAGRAGEVLNPFRGLSLKNSFPLSPFTLENEDERDEPASEIEIGKRCRYEALDNTAKRLFIVDSGLAFNSPYPLVLRPQRAVDMYFSFDFSQRPSDNHMPFKELLLAEKWATQNQVPFPPIEKLANEYSKDKEVKELYIFKDPDNVCCPVILHFTIVNNKFRHFKAPGVPRKTAEEREFANFNLFDDPDQPYSSTNFVYEPLQFERLFQLIYFNTMLNIDTIKKEIEDMVKKKKDIMSQRTENTFKKINAVMKFVSHFKSNDSLRLRICDKNKKKLLIACLSNESNKDPYVDAPEEKESSDDDDTEFVDAPESSDISENASPDVTTNTTNDLTPISEEVLPESTSEDHAPEKEIVKMIENITAVL